MKALWIPITAVVFASFPADVVAQWPSHPKAGEPRTAGGKVNLEAPAPRTADGHPDLSGIWQFQNTRGVGAGNAPPAAAPPPRDPLSSAGGGLGPAPPPGSSQFFNIGSTLKDGIFYWRPGAGFFGKYGFVFEDPSGDQTTVHITVGRDSPRH